MERRLALIGFGEAARAFAPGLRARLSGYDRKTDTPDLRDQTLDAFAIDGVVAGDTAAAALEGAKAVLSLVTADQALAAAQASEALEPDTLWFDMNSVAPQTKRAAAQAVTAHGGRYVDVAVMAPVHPKRTAVPLLVSGPHAEEGAALLTAVGFTNVRVVAGDVGAASAIKMIRSVMVKGIEALSAECALAADAAGVLDEVIASLDASPPPAGWAERFDYNLDRMLVHGARRAAEMEEVVATLDALGTGSAMSRGTVERQRTLGQLSIAPPGGLSPKLRTLAPFVRPAPGNRAA
jgi:3-hydroxyisobutyrate dehydrogenase-like beta-hydroxyacid dehydrogenase